MLRLFRLITNWGGGYYQLRSALAAKHIWVEVITRWGILDSPLLWLKSWNIEYYFKWNQPFLSQVSILSHDSNSLNLASVKVNWINLEFFNQAKTIPVVLPSSPFQDLENQSRGSRVIIRYTNRQNTKITTLFWNWCMIFQLNFLFIFLFLTNIILNF